MKSSGATGGGAGFRVFNHQRPSNAEAFGCQKIGLRVRFSVLYILTGDDGGKAVADAGAFEDRLDFGAAGGGDDGELQMAQLTKQDAGCFGNGGIGIGLFPE